MRTCEPEYCMGRVLIIVVILIMLILPAGLKSQIIVESSDMPSPGDTVRLSTGLNTGFIDYVQTGEDFLWDFSQLVPVVQTVDTFVTPSETPFFYQIFFVLYSNLANRFMRDIPIPDFELSNIYYFYKNDNARFSNIGYAASINGIPLPVRFDNPDVVYRFPLQYSDRDSSSSRVEYDIPNMGYLLVDRTRRNVVDGWGTLITPFGTFEVLRVKSEVHEFDSLYIDSIQMGVPIDRNFIEYKWLAKGQKEPLLQITSDIVGGLFVVYRDSLRMGLDAVNENPVNGNTMAIYPNPAASMLFVEFDMLKPVNVELSVYDITGKKLYGKQLAGIRKGVNRKTLNLGSLNLADGMYLMKLKAGSQIVTKKLMIKN